MDTQYGVFFLIGTLVGTFVGGYFAFRTAKLQVDAATRRFTKELEQRNLEMNTSRRHEARSVPLLKLRDEVAQMAAQYLSYFAAANEVDPSSPIAEKELRGVLRAYQDRWTAYAESLALDQALYLQSDSELVAKVNEVRYDLVLSYLARVNPELVDSKEREDAGTAIIRSIARIADLQKMITERLESL